MTRRACWWALGALVVLSAAPPPPLAAQDTIAPVKGAHPAPPAPAAAPARPAPAAAPAAPASDTGSGVRPGMSEAQVEARWGPPAAVRRLNDWTYLFYRNGRERDVGYYDTVFLQNDQVVDAIVRSPEHVYLGVSSSPEGVVSVPPGAAPPDSAAGVTGVTVKPGR